MRQPECLRFRGLLAERSLPVIYFQGHARNSLAVTVRGGRRRRRERSGAAAPVYIDVLPLVCTERR